MCKRKSICLQKSVDYLQISSVIRNESPTIQNDSNNNLNVSDKLPNSTNCKEIDKNKKLQRERETFSLKNPKKSSSHLSPGKNNVNCLNDVSKQKFISFEHKNNNNTPINMKKKILGEYTKARNSCEDEQKQKSSSASSSPSDVDNMMDETSTDIDAQDSLMICDTTQTSDRQQNDKDKTKPYACEDCGKSFSQLRNYKYHR